MAVTNINALGCGSNVKYNPFVINGVKNRALKIPPLNFNTQSQTGGYTLNHPNNKVDGIRCDAFDYLA